MRIGIELADPLQDVMRGIGAVVRRDLDGGHHDGSQPAAGSTSSRRSSGQGRPQQARGTVSTAELRA